MRVYSFFKKNLDLEPIEIEVSFVPGIPAFHVTGLPEAAIK
jgi:predicted ATPase with chaperone activity